MRRREFVSLLGSAAAWPLVTRAQQPGMPVIGVVDGFPDDGLNSKAFRQGLAEGGIVVGRDAKIEHRQITSGRSNELVLELVKRRVTVIVAGGGSAVAAMQAKAATSTIPIVFAMGANPVTMGLVASLSRPGGNVTGVTFLTTELSGKRLDLLHKLIPMARKVGYLSTADASAGGLEQRHDIAAAAEELGQELLMVDCEFRISSLQDAFTAMVEAGVEGVIVHASPFLLADRGRVVDLAARHRLPTIYPATVYARVGGLVSYSADVSDGFRLAGSQYVARILKGAKAEDLPVQQPTKFELVINLKTARNLGLEVPPTLLAIADGVIE